MKDYRVVIYVANLADDVDPEEWLLEIIGHGANAHPNEPIISAWRVTVADTECVGPVDLKGSER